METGCCMFERPHHQRIAAVLETFHRGLLEEAGCYFAGGTAIVMQLGEYRESRDIDFLCSSKQGFRLLRETVTQNSLGDLLTSPATYRREVRLERDRISTFIAVAGEPIKVEFLLEGNIEIGGAYDPRFKVPTLSREDLYAEKLLANADRGMDKATMSRDLIDLSMMLEGWGPVPSGAWEKATKAYGSQVARSLGNTLTLIENRGHLAWCLVRMRMDPALVDRIPQLATSLSRSMPSPGSSMSLADEPTPLPCP